MMDWQSFRQGKGQSVQNFTEEFRKKALELKISLDSPDTLLKYIGALHHYLCHTLLLKGESFARRPLEEAFQAQQQPQVQKEGQEKKDSYFQERRRKAPLQPLRH